MRYRFLPLFIAALAGCQGPEPQAPGAPLLRLRFPEGLRTPAARWERFEKRVIQLECTARTRSGQVFRAAAGPLSWGTLSFPETGFPADKEDALEVQVRVWDRTREGLPRSYPVVQGHKRISAGEWGPGAEVPIHLTLQVSVKDYD